MSTPRSASLPKVSSSSIHRFRDHLRGNHMNSSDTMSVPEGFLWGTAISAHQSEGNNVNSDARSEEHTSELQSLMRISYAVFCLKKKKKQPNKTEHHTTAVNMSKIRTTTIITLLAH